MDLPAAREAAAFLLPWELSPAVPVIAPPIALAGRNRASAPKCAAA